MVHVYKKNLKQKAVAFTLRCFYFTKILVEVDSCGSLRISFQVVACVFVDLAKKLLRWKSDNGQNSIQLVHIWKETREYLLNQPTETI